MVRSLASIFWIAGLSLVAPVSGQTEPELSRELPWFTEAAKPPVLPEILVGNDWMAGHLGSSGVVAVDVRPASAYEAGHLPGAVHLEIPPDPAAQDLVLTRLGRASLGGTETLVLYGGDEDRPSLGLAFLSLSGAGWERLKVLGTGFETWSRSHFPVAKDRPARPEASLAAHAAPLSPFVTREDLLASFGRKGFEVLDLRGGWGAGYTAPARFAAGHIPHALPFDVQTSLPATGWPDPVQARQALLALGPRASEHVQADATFLLYGDGPADPALGLTFLLLRTWGFSVRVFSPGFPGWAAEAADPVVRIVSAGEARDLLAQEQPGKRKADSLRDELPKGLIFLDLREDWDYNDEHIPGAFSLPEHLFAERFDAVLRERWPAADPARTPLLLYCYGRECTRSRNCATAAAQKGFRKILWLREGMSGWEELDHGPAAP